MRLNYLRGQKWDTANIILNGREQEKMSNRRTRRQISSEEV